MHSEENGAENTAENIQNESLTGDSSQGDSKVYEVGYLLVPTESQEGVPALYGNMKELISTIGGNLIADEMPKLIQLAYTMQKVYKNVRGKYDMAYFGWFKFTMDATDILKLKAKLDLDPSIIRFLIVKTVKENTIASRRFMHREGMPRRMQPLVKRDASSGEAPVEINKEEIDKEIDALVSEPEAVQ